VAFLNGIRGFATDDAFRSTELFRSSLPPARERIATLKIFSLSTITIMNSQQQFVGATQAIEQKFTNMEDYVCAQPVVKQAFKKLQLAQLKLLALDSINPNKRRVYTALYTHMRRWKSLDSIIARPERSELLILRRRWLIGLLLRRNGFRYVRELKAWLYRPLEK
jgi:hypothetical protein